MSLKGRASGGERGMVGSPWLVVVVGEVGGLWLRLLVLGLAAMMFVF